MADVTKQLRPRRGKKSVMAGATKKTIVLASGELFVEAPDAGVGKAGGHKIKIGDGTTQYGSLPYALGDTPNDKIDFAADTSTSVTNALNGVTSGTILKTIVSKLKKAIELMNTTVTKINDDISAMKTSFQDGCDTLVNKATALGVTPKSNSPTDIANAMQSIYDNRYAAGQTAGASASKVGTAAVGDVLKGKTFTNASTVGATGTMANNGAVSKTFTPTSASQSYTVPAGYHNGSGKVTCSATPTQEKSTTPTNGTTVTVTPDAGKFLSKVTVVTSTCYNNGVNAGAAAVTSNPNAYGLYTAAQTSTYYSNGVNDGVAAVKGNPNPYGLYTADQYNANYNAGRTQGQNDVKANPGSYGMTGTFTPGTSTSGSVADGCNNIHNITCGFQPNCIIIFNTEFANGASNRTNTLIYLKGHLIYGYKNAGMTPHDDSSWTGCRVVPTANGFTAYTGDGSSYANNIWRWIAAKV